jgi:hypothetical protein
MPVRKRAPTRSRGAKRKWVRTVTTDSTRMARGCSSQRRRPERGYGLFHLTRPTATSPANRVPLRTGVREKSTSMRAPTARRSPIARFGAGRNELWERSIAEGHERLLLSSADWRFTKPRWSPDGAKLAFSRCATRDNTLAVAVLDTDGGGESILTRPTTSRCRPMTGRGTGRPYSARVDSFSPSDTPRV